MPRNILYISLNIADLSVTFIYREITDLRQMGVEIETVSLNKPPPERVSREATELFETTLYLDQIHILPKVLACVRIAALRPGSFWRCLKLIFTATPVKSTRDYLRLGYHLVEACYLALKYAKRKPEHIHSHFLTGSTSIAMFLAELLDIPFSFTSHGSLIWMDPIGLYTKLALCKFSVTISHYNKAYLLSTYGRHFESKLHVVRCGIVMPDTRLRRPPDPGDRSISVLSVARLFECKGFHILIDAVRILRDRGSDISCTIVGDGNQRLRLERMIEHFGLRHQVSLVGAQPHERIPEYLHKADIFALPCVIAEDGKRDGLPVSLMEAMAWRLPVISTNIPGFSELIDSGTEGILIRPNDPLALAEAIAELSGSPQRRNRLGTAGAKKIEEEFSAVRSAQRLAELFGS